MITPHRHRRLSQRNAAALARHSALFKAVEWLKQQDSTHAAVIFCELRRLNHGRRAVLQKPVWPR